MKQLAKENLNVDAIIPQCLDNQYIPDNILNFMLKHEYNFQTPEINKVRMLSKKREYVRALIYSSQVIFNRTFLISDICMMDLYNITDEKNAIAKLIKQEAIIPHLMRQNSLDEKIDFQAHNVVPFTKLLDAVGDEYSAVKFSWNTEQNDIAIEQIGLSFQTQLIGLKKCISKPNIQKMMFSEVFQTSSDNNLCNEFSNALEDISKYSYLKDAIDRKSIYEEFFINKSKFNNKVLVDTGEYAPHLQNPAYLGAKKVVDLCYNNNLSQYLDRFLLTPMNLPTIDALSYLPQHQRKDVNTNVLSIADDAAKYFKDLQRRLQIDMSKAMDLPLYENFKMTDVLAVRESDEWHKFIETQQNIFANPTNVLNDISTYQRDLENLHRYISEYAKKRPHLCNPHTRMRKYSPYVSLSIKVGTKSIILGLLECSNASANLSDMCKQMISELVSEIPKQISIKLINAVIDAKTKKIDEALSYSINLISEQTTVTKDKIAPLITQLENLTSEQIIEKNTNNEAQAGY